MKTKNSSKRKKEKTRSQLNVWVLLPALPPMCCFHSLWVWCFKLQDVSLNCDAENKLQYLTTWWKDLTHWKRPWCWEKLRAGGEGRDRGWENPGVLQSLGLQRVGYNWTTGLNWNDEGNDLSYIQCSYWCVIILEGLIQISSLRLFIGKFIKSIVFTNKPKISRRKRILRNMLAARFY